MKTKNAPAQQRASVPALLPPLLAEFGVPLEAVLAGTGVRPADLTHQTFLPFAAVLAIFERAALLTGCEDLGLRLGKRQTLAQFGPAGRAMRHASTLAEALTDFAEAQISNSTGSAVYVYRTDDDLALGYGIYDADGQVATQIHDVVLAVGCNIVSELTDGAVCPVELWTMRPPPRDPAPFYKLANCPVRFGQWQTCVFLPENSADFALPALDRSARDAAFDDLAAVMNQIPGGIVVKVRRALRTLMLSDRIGMPDVAAHLGLHPRSLRRSLARENTTFVALREEVRVVVARELLTLTALPISDIATTLSYATPTSFTHAFRRHSGAAPTDWRQEHAKASGFHSNRH
jgi:AraC-like DNA-binding protein